MMQLLDSMEEYDWHTRILNTNDFGVPQNRPRLYIVGIRRIHAKKAFVWPTPMADNPQLDEFLDPVAQPLNGDDLVSSLPTADVKRMKILGAIGNLMNQPADDRSGLLGRQPHCHDHAEPHAMFDPESRRKQGALAPS